MTHRIHGSDPELATRREDLGEGRVLVIHEELEQGSPDWFYARAGRLTASRFSGVVTPKTRKPSVSALDLALELALERFRGAPLSLDFRSGWGDRGLKVEPDAREWYAMHRGSSPYEVGFCGRDDLEIGCSPDALVDDDPEGPGGCEIKCRSPEEHAKSVLGWRPIADATQIQSSLFVTRRNWWDEVAYCPGLPGAIIRHRPDPEWQAIFEEIVPKFLDGVEILLEKLRALGPVRFDDEAATLERSLETLYPPQAQELDR